MFDLVISGGRIYDGTGHPWFHADVGITGDRITAVDRLAGAEARRRIDAAGLAVCPGFIDAHVHGDLMLLADPLMEPAVRQGVTTFILGQDGSAMAPASPATLDYMRRYTAGFNGHPDLPPDRLPADGFLSIDTFLNLFDRQSALNVACLIPNGNVRMEAMALESRAPEPDELDRMRRLVREGMEQGAVGLSSGLDYVPSRYATTEELIALGQEIAPFGGVYATHVRSYSPLGYDGAMDEVCRIAREAGVAVSVSHFNVRGDKDLVRIDAARAEGLDVTYDLYCYLAGSSILAMIGLPPWVQTGALDTRVWRIKDAVVRKQLEPWFGFHHDRLANVVLAHAPAETHRQYEGLTLGRASALADQALPDFLCDVLVATRLRAGGIAPHESRIEEDVTELMRHPAMMAGSDGIYVGRCCHPRGWGCFARYLGHYVREAKTWPLEEAVAKLSGHAARRYRLKDRGFLREGLAADVVVFDPAAVRDLATYETPRRLAEGVRFVCVNGTPLLADGRRTEALPGRALRRG